jgi:hypothetical protein
VGPLAVGCGFSLIILGVGFFFGTGQEHLTALIPAFFGVVLVVLGLLARKDNLRKHVMHAAAALALAGVIIPLVRLWPTITTGEIKSEAAVTELAFMALICAAFVILCVRSFLMARRSRAQSEPK